MLPWMTRTWFERVGPHDLIVEGIADFEEACGQLAREARRAEVATRYQALCPMFGVIWPAARGLANRLASMDLRGQRVLELGCGLALPSMAAARAGGRVLATDQHPDTERFLRRNLEHNGITNVEYASLDWESPSPDLAAEQGFDQVVGSDVLYTAEMPDLVARAYARFLRPGGQGWLTDPGRPWLQDFATACGDLGMATTEEVVAGADGRDEVFLLAVVARPTAGTR